MRKRVTLWIEIFLLNYFVVLSSLGIFSLTMFWMSVTTNILNGILSQDGVTWYKYMMLMGSICEKLYFLDKLALLRQDQRLFNCLLRPPPSPDMDQIVQIILDENMVWIALSEAANCHLSGYKMQLLRLQIVFSQAEDFINTLRWDYL